MNKKRRARNTGSVYQLHSGPKAGWYAASISLGFDAKNRRQRIYIVRKTQREVSTELAKRMATIAESGAPAREHQSLEQFLERWLADVVRTTTRPKTALSYAGAMKTHVIPLLGSRPVAKISAQQAQWLFAELERRGASARTRLNVYVVLSRAMKQAVRWGIAARNPLDGVDRPRVARREMDVWNLEEQQQFVAATRTDRYWALYVLALATGMREGELLALQWADIDIREKTVSVNKTVVDILGTLSVTDVKTSTSRRKIALPAGAIEALSIQKERAFMNGHRASKWVFPAPEGGLLSPRNFIARWWDPHFDRGQLARRKNCGVRRIRFHDLRHTAATTMLTLGVHPKVVQEMLGHSSIRTTLDLYSHVIPQMKSDAAARWDAALPIGRATTGFP